MVRQINAVSLILIGIYDFPWFEKIHIWGCNNL